MQETLRVVAQAAGACDWHREEFLYNSCQKTCRSCGQWALLAHDISDYAAMIGDRWMIPSGLVLIAAIIWVAILVSTNGAANSDTLGPALHTVRGMQPPSAVLVV